ncbi:FAD-dependent oxidoreductase [Chitinimonas sp.]|uniref:FAD-dependent oxidoreductase n=1 Tax=Chitinimonas sp. TaxID=1934313 RepID=UPI002F937BDA
MAAPLTIVGSGLAAYNLAREWRKHAPDAELCIVTADAGDFYSKPMLSNGLNANKTAAQLAMKSAEKMAEELKATLLTHTRVSAIDRAAHEIETSAGRLAYSQLVLALGADSTRAELGGNAAEAVLRVNDLADYAIYREALDGKQRVVLLGGGLIGCEFANDLVATGHQVEVVDIAAWPLSRFLPEAAGHWMAQRLSAAGIRFHWQQQALRLDHDEDGYLLTLSDGTVLKADVVLSALGLRPRTALAAAAGLATSRGIVVDRHLRSSDPDIYALGDCAEVEGLVLPFVLPIMQAARALAPTLAGQATALAYPAMPVVVKTPACPAVIAPPASACAGEWQIESGADGLRALYCDAAGKLQGLVLLGEATKERQTLAAQLPATLA